MIDNINKELAHAILFLFLLLYFIYWLMILLVSDASSYFYSLGYRRISLATTQKKFKRAVHDQL